MEKYWFDSVCSSELNTDSALSEFPVAFWRQRRISSSSSIIQIVSLDILSFFAKIVCRAFKYFYLVL